MTTYLKKNRNYSNLVSTKQFLLYLIHEQAGRHKYNIMYTLGLDSSHTKISIKLRGILTVRNFHFHIPSLKLDLYLYNICSKFILL